MRAFVGVSSLLAVAALVGAFAVQELYNVGIAAGGPGAVISAATTAVTLPPDAQPIPPQAPHSVEIAVYQARPAASAGSDD